MEILAEIVPLDPATGARVTLRVASSQDPRITNLNAVRWWPAITEKPSLSDDFFDGDFVGDPSVGGATIPLAMFGLKRLDPLAPGYRYAGATVTLYAANAGLTAGSTALTLDSGTWSFDSTAFPSFDATFDTALLWPWPVVFNGVVDSFGSDDERLTLNCKVDTTPFEAPAMTLLYAGTTGIEGPADLKNKVKPWCFGAPKNVEPVLIDVNNSVYQVSAYGPINAVAAVYEKAASFGAATGDFASYTALVAATIPPGRWATCLANGLFRLGAPAAGVITADVEGDKPGGTWLRRTGAIINRVLTNASVAAGRIDAASLTNLDTVVARNVSLYLSEQTTCLELVRRLSKPCNAQAGVNLLGKLHVSRFGGIGAPAAIFDAQGRRLPAVKDCVEQSVSMPYWRIEMGGDRAWRVQTFEEIAFTAELMDMGDYVVATTYREGNIVTNQGGRWLYVSPTPAAGNAPPVLPTTTNAYWTIQTLPINYADVGGTKPPGDADNTASNTPDLIGAVSFAVTASSTGVIDAGQLPLAQRFRTMRGPVDVSPTSGFVLSAISAGLVGNLAINNTPGDTDRGVLTWSTGGSGSAVLTATLSTGAAVVKTLTFAVNRAGASSSGTGGAGSGGTVTSFSSTNTASYGFTINSTAFPAVTIAAGQTLTMSAVLYFAVSRTTPMGNFGLAGKAQYRLAGGTTWTDFPGGESAADYEAYVYSEPPIYMETGQLTINRSVAPSAGSYETQLLVRTSGSGAATRQRTVTGSATVGAS